MDDADYRNVEGMRGICVPKSKFLNSTRSKELLEEVSHVVLLETLFHVRGRANLTQLAENIHMHQSRNLLVRDRCSAYIMVARCQ